MGWYKDASGKPVWQDDAPRGIPIGMQDPTMPYKAQGAALDNQGKAANIQNDAARIALARAAEARAGRSEDRAGMTAAAALYEKGLRPDGRGGVELIPGWSPPVKAPQLTSEVRQKALSQWNAADQVERQMGKVQQRFNEGPGATSPIFGVLDYLPTPSNENFDESANRLRPLLKNLLGVTGGENNAVAEMKLNLGAYVPNRWKTDKTNRTTMGDIGDVARSAREQAVQTLGGIPGANGQVVPLPPGYKYGQDPEEYGRQKVVKDTVEMLRKLRVPQDRWEPAIDKARRDYELRRAAKAPPRKPASGGIPRDVQDILKKYGGN